MVNGLPYTYDENLAVLLYRKNISLRISRTMKGILLFIRHLPYPGMALFPFILIRQDELPLCKRLLNHERIHLRQQLELLILPFYLWYLLDYLFQRLKGKKHHAAYRSIIFEKEAYAHEDETGYPERRKLWAFIRKRHGGLAGDLKE